MTRGDGRSSRTGVLLLALLLSLIAAAAVWNTTVRAPRAAEREVALLPGDPLPPGWGAFVVGQPSGADPVRVVEPSEPEPAPRTSEEYELSPVSDFELVVQPGQVLSRIVQVYYGAAEPQLIQNLAAYNSLASPDALQVGATLRLPSERRLRSLAE